MGLLVQSPRTIKPRVPEAFQVTAPDSEQVELLEELQSPRVPCQDFGGELSQAHRQASGA